MNSESSLSLSLAWDSSLPESLLERYKAPADLHPPEERISTDSEESSPVVICIPAGGKRAESKRVFWMKDHQAHRLGGPAISFWKAGVCEREEWWENDQVRQQPGAPSLILRSKDGTVSLVNHWISAKTCLSVSKKKLERKSRERFEFSLNSTLGVTTVASVTFKQELGRPAEASFSTVIAGEKVSTVELALSRGELVKGVFPPLESFLDPVRYFSTFFEEALGAEYDYFLETGGKALSPDTLRAYFRHEEEWKKYPFSWWHPLAQAEAAQVSSEALAGE